MQFFCSYHMITLSSSPLGILTSLDQIFHPLAINTFAQGEDEEEEENGKYFEEEEESGEIEENNFCISGNGASNDENGIERQLHDCGTKRSQFFREFQERSNIFLISIFIL